MTLFMCCHVNILFKIEEIKVKDVFNRIKVFVIRFYCDFWRIGTLLMLLIPNTISKSVIRFSCFSSSSIYFSLNFKNCPWALINGSIAIPARLILIHISNSFNLLYADFYPRCNHLFFFLVPSLIHILPLFIFELVLIQSEIYLSFHFALKVFFLLNSSKAWCSTSCFTQDKIQLPKIQLNFHANNQS